MSKLKVLVSLITNDNDYQIEQAASAQTAAIVIAEVYKGVNTTVAKLAEKYASHAGMKMLDIDEHRELFTQAGYSDVQVATEPDKGWICAIGRRP